MNFTLYGFFLVSLLTIQVKGVPSVHIIQKQPNDLKDNTTLLYEELTIHALEKVNQAYLVIWPLPETLGEYAEKVINEAVVKLPDTIKGVFDQIQILRDSASNLDLDFEICKNTSDIDMNKYFDDIQFQMEKNIWSAYSGGLAGINYQLGQLNTILAEVFDQGNKLDNCETDKCFAEVENELLVLQGMLDRRVNTAQVGAQNSVIYYTKLMDQYPIEAVKAVKEYGDSIMSSIKDCLKRH